MFLVIPEGERDVTELSSDGKVLCRWGVSSISLSEEVFSPSASDSCRNGSWAFIGGRTGGSDWPADAVVDICISSELSVALSLSLFSFFLSIRFCFIL